MIGGFGALVIGDEILVGKRQDKHFPWLIEALAKRGLRLAWCEHLGDEPARIGRHTLDCFLLDADPAQQRLVPKEFRVITHI